MVQIKETSPKEEKLKLLSEIRAQSIITREVNLRNFKSRIFKPKYPWGVDEKRIEKLSKKRREVTCSEKQIKKSINRIKQYNKSLASPSPEATPQKKCPHTSRPEIKLFLKNQRLSRKMSKVQEYNQRLEKETRRILQLKAIDVISKQILKKKQKVAKKKKTSKKILKKCEPIKWVQKKLDEFSENKVGSTERFKKVRESEMGEDEVVGLIRSKPDYKISIECINDNREQSKSPSENWVFEQSPRSMQLKEMKKIKMRNQEKLEEKLEKAKQQLNGFGKYAEKDEKKAVVQRERPEINKIGGKDERFTALDDSNSWMYKKLYPENPESFNEEDDEVKKIIGVFHMDNYAEVCSVPMSRGSKKSDLMEFSPILKDMNLSFTDLDPNDVIKHKNNEKLMASTQQNSPLLEKIREKTIKLFRFLVFNQLKTLYKIPDEQKKLALDYLSSLLFKQNERFIQYFHQSLENLSNHLTLTNLQKFVEKYPEIQEFLSEKNDFFQDSSESCSIHDTPEPLIQHPIFKKPLLYSTLINGDTLPSFPIFKDSSYDQSFDIFDDPASEDFFILLNDSVFLLFCEIFFNEAVEDAFFYVIVENVDKIGIAIVENEVAMVEQELKSGINDESLVNYTDRIFDVYGEEIFQNLRIDRREDPLDVLSCMQESEIGLGSFQEYYEEIIPTQSFLETITGDSLQVCIYKKLIFDCINEGLFPLCHKSSMPWSTSHQTPKKSESSAEVYYKIFTLLLKWNTCKLGKILNSPKMTEQEEAFNKLREDRIFAVLSQELKESDIKWINYEFEEIQLRLDISDMILELLVEEIMECL